MVDIFRALAEESRLRILALVMQEEMCVCEIEACLKMTQSNASRHLTALKSIGILDSYKNAQWTYYKISERFKEENHDLWRFLEHKFKETPNYQVDIVEGQRCKSQNLCSSKTPPEDN